MRLILVSLRMSRATYPQHHEKGVSPSLGTRKGCTTIHSFKKAVSSRSLHLTPFIIRSPKMGTLTRRYHIHPSFFSIQYTGSSGYHVPLVSTPSPCLPLPSPPFPSLPLPSPPFPSLPLPSPAFLTLPYPNQPPTNPQPPSHNHNLNQQASFIN